MKVPGSLPMWTIYERPEENPTGYVARCWIATANREPAQVGPLLLADSLQAIRALLPRGLTLIPRDPSDHHTIVETWI